MNAKLHFMPVNLLIAGRRCLVVGAGKVALRKVRGLLDAGARVVIVSSEYGSDFEALVASGAIEMKRRPFQSADVEGMELVFAATDDRGVNRAVLDACRADGILCCCVDGNWRDGDFTTPAVTRHDDISVAISTGGQSCRRSKLVKNALARHIESIDSADLIVVGTDHHHLPLAERERFHLTSARADKIGFMLMQIWGVHEFMLLDTCNRVEIAAIVSREAGTNGILRHVLGLDRLAPESYYLKRGAAAWEHMALVCAGMGSQTPGEKHIAGQVKDALASASRKGWASGMMQDWIAAALHTSKHIKNEVVPAMPKCEIEELALKYLLETVPDLEKKSLMLIGSGEIGMAVFGQLREKVARVVWCYHSRRPQPRMGREGEIELCPLDKMREHLRQVDLIISAIDVDGYAFGPAEIEQIDPGRIVCVIDLGVPRNTDPALRNHSNLKSLVDMDDLKRWYQSELADMEEHIESCRSIIADHRGQCERLINSFQGGNSD